MFRCAIFLLAAVLASAATPDHQQEKEILATMDAYKEAFMKKDAVALARILSDDLIYTHSSTQHQDKAAVLASLKNKTIIEAMDFHDLKIRVYGGAAVVTTDIETRSNNAGAVTSSRLHVLHVLVKTAQGWQVVARQATRSPDTVGK
jgi:ketosteroid isomerase-like protein